MNLLTKLLLTFIFTTLVTNALAADPCILLWDGLTKQYVQPGINEGMFANLVDYAGISQDVRYWKLLNQLVSVDVRTFTPEEQKAFWINAYNIAAVKLLIENPSAQKIEDLGWWIFSVWGKEVLTIGTQRYSLDKIRNDILRKYGDLRINFALCTTELSAPDLRVAAYAADKIEGLLDAQTKVFLKNETKGCQLSKKNKTLTISLLFDKYRDDFGKEAGTLNFIGRMLERELGDFSISYLNYDKRINRLHVVKMENSI